MTDIYEETDFYEAPVQDDYPYDHHYDDEFYEDYYPEDEFIYDEDEEAPAERKTGKGRVVHLVLIVCLILLLIGVIIFGIVPYVSAMTQSTAPLLAPAVQA